MNNRLPPPGVILFLRVSGILLGAATQLRAAEAPSLAGTEQVAFSEDRSAEMVSGIQRWLDRETVAVRAERSRVWREAASGGQWQAFVETRRATLRQIIAPVDARRAPGIFETISEVGAAPSAPDNHYSIQRVRWPVLDGVDAEGVLFQPSEPRAIVIAIPDADEPPETLPLAHRLAAEGCIVLAPLLIDRGDQWSGNDELQRFTNQPHREWIYRQAFEVGRTLIGYEVEKILAGLDTLVALEMKVGRGDAAIGIAGHGEGGLLALHCAALDTRFRTALISGYFAPRERLFGEPIYRNLFGYLREFGDAELAALIAPRGLIVEHSRGPEITGPPPSRKDRSGAAPGAIATPKLLDVAREVARANELIGHVQNASPVTLIQGTSDEPVAPGSPAAIAALLARLNLSRPSLAEPEAIMPMRLPETRQRSAVRDLERFTQRLARTAERGRDAAIWAKITPSADWDRLQRTTREKLWRDVIGKLPAASMPPKPRTRLVREETKWIGYEVLLDVLPDVFAWGWLLVPRDLDPGERRPVVVCQHGLEGLPEDVVNLDPKASAFAAYKGFASSLAERGFVVYAPHNPYRGGDKFRVLQRRANPLGLSLFSFIIAQHDVTTQWLASLSFVDPTRIGFYGLSYGGKTAMRVPALLDRYCLSICSADFNEWVFKNVSTDSRFSYMFTGEYEMPEWNLASVCNYAEMAMLIAPRPFMVERGHLDGVAVDEWVGYEYAKVRRGYTKLGLPDRTAIEWFEGPHTIHGRGTFEFLHKHLAWAIKRQPAP